jgi:UDP-2,3-diacylglucosamine hydrolase
MDKKKIGLVAGRGYLPLEVLSEIKKRSATSVVVGLKGEVDPKISGLADHYQELATGHLGEIIGFLKSFDIQELVLAGKVTKETLFHGGFDPVFLQLLQELPEKNDDAILKGVVNEFNKNGLPVAKQTDYLHHLLAEPGPIAGEITEDESADVKLGYRVAKAIGGLDIGQSVVVKRGVVLAVEAIEGTDQAIIRGGKLGGPGTVVVKVSKPNQDERFDVPTIGKSTIKSMIIAQATVLGIEAQKTLITEDRKSVV